MIDLEKKAEEMYIEKYGVCPGIEKDIPIHSYNDMIEFAKLFSDNNLFSKILKSSPEQKSQWFASQNGWIDVKERLPEIGSSVLTYPSFRTLPFGVKENEDLQGDPTDYNFWEFSFNLEKAILVPNVTHWMPLPQPPQIK